MPTGEKITFADGRLVVPDHPILPFIEGDGTGPEIWAATRPVLDAAVQEAYGKGRSISWLEVLAGHKAFERTGEWLPEATLDAMREHLVSIKGPLATPVGTGIRSLNVAIRQRLDLFACVREIRHMPGVPSPMLHPEKLDVILFRENTEDVYAGLEWPAGSDEANALIDFIKDRLGRKVRPESGMGIKPQSRFASERLVRMALEQAISRGRRNATLVHKGNIMKFTEGAFREWGYELARAEFRDRIVTEEEVEQLHDGRVPGGKLLLRDRIADSMFQQILLRPEDYDVIITTNLNGDYLSDAAAAQVGGLGMAPGANIGIPVANFEATHGTAPKHAGRDRVNPSSLILSGAMMFAHMGWTEAALLVREALTRTVGERRVTYDLHRQMRKATLLSCSGFGRAVVERIESGSQ
jgi:isocitrate dehydrogenase